MKVEHVRLFGLNEIMPSPENAQLYKPVTPDDEATIELAQSIRERGVLEPLKISADYYVISGHRRLCAARIAGLSKVPCRVDKVRRGHGEQASPEFLNLLREHNRQRVKTRDELLREAVVSVDPLKAHKALTAYRKRKAKVRVETIEIREGTRRKTISPAKQAFLAAVQKIIFSLEEFWPLSLRQIHYGLLNDPPLIHSAKPDSLYRNNLQSYHSLSDLVTRARHEGSIDYEVIHDPTRPVTVWNVYRDLSSYYQQQMEDLLNGYWRDLMQSQPNHIEIVVEKNTLHGIVTPVASRFCIPFTIGRGQCTTRPLYNIAKRYQASGKDKLIILAMSDLDPDGDAIAHSLGQRLRDDYRIRQTEVVKTALTMKQIRALKLPKKFERAKTGSSNYARYVEAYGTDFVWELEALAPKVLQKLLTQAIDSVIDKAAFNAEVAQERADATHNAAVREIVLRTLQAQISLGSGSRPSEQHC
jgi:flagellar hook-basal body complex protein FliE